VGGFVAGALFAASPAFCRAAIAAGPTTLTLSLALASVLALVVHADERKGPGWLYAAVLAAGLAAANEPAFIVLGMVAVVFGALVTRYDGWRAGLVVILALAVFAAAIAVPSGVALGPGESIHRFFFHAFLQACPEPLVGGAQSAHWSETMKVPSWWLLLLFGLPGLLFMLRRSTRGFGLLGVAIALLFGSLFPGLIDGLGARSIVRDSAAPQLMEVAAACMFVGWGLIGLAQLESSWEPRRTTRRRAALDMGSDLLIMALLVSMDVWHLPVRDSAITETIGKDLLNACPKGAILLSGDPYTTSLAVAMQHEFGYREDVCVVPISSLAPFATERAALEALLGDRAHLPEEFPPPAAEDGWPSEQPVLFARFLAERAEHPPVQTALRDLAIWEFVKENYRQAPLCFVGFSSPWLAPRAAIAGLTLAYPRPTAPLDDAHNKATDILDDQPSEAFFDPYLARTLTTVLRPLIQAARRQDLSELSFELVMAMLDLDADQLTIDGIRRAARGGDKEEALRYAAEYLEDADTGSHVEDLQAVIAEELDACALEAGFMALVNAEARDAPDLDARTEMAARLWEADALSLLVRGYSQILERSPEDADALYQLAAAYTQLGDLSKASDMLERWLTCAGLPPRGAAEQLHKDGRFVLLRHYHSEENAPN